MFTHLRPVSVERRDTGSILWSLTVRRNQSRSFRLCQSSSSSSSSWGPGSRLSPGQRPSPATSCQPSERRWRSRWRSAEPPNLTEPLSVLLLQCLFSFFAACPTHQNQSERASGGNRALLFYQKHIVYAFIFSFVCKRQKSFVFLSFQNFYSYWNSFGKKHWELYHFNTQQFVFLWQYFVQQSSNKVTHLKWKRRTSPKAALVVRDVVCLPRGHYLAQADRWGRPWFRLMGGLKGSACCVPAAAVLSCLKPVSGTRSLQWISSSNPTVTSRN